MTLIHWQPRRRINWVAIEAFAVALGLWMAFWGLFLPALINAVIVGRG